MLYAVDSAPTAPSFARDVKPILAEHCIKCHGPDKAEGGVDFTRRETLVQERDSGSVPLIAGNADKSHLIERISTEDSAIRMPPEQEKPLSKQSIDVLRRWIDSGAEFEVHWSFRSVVKPSTPTVRRMDWIKHPIDAFVLAQLEREGFEPSPEAPTHQLIRRLYLDLTGLLPTPDKMESLSSEWSVSSAAQRDAVYESLVDELLSSEHFGERWGRHWLDLARYADSDGYEKDRPRPDAYIYRDWVIRAFNENMPFDQFTVEQLAGDLLPNATPSQRIATAFNRQTLTNTEGGVDQEEYRVAAVFDRTDTLGSVWLGLTLGCAKCHTHKYDPIQHTDYYRLFAYFNEAEEFVEKLPINDRIDKELLQELVPLEQELKSYYRSIYDAQQKWEAEQRELVEHGANTPLKFTEERLTLEVESEGGLVFREEKDGSVRVVSTDTVPERDTYTIHVAGLPREITGLRLETVPDPEFPKSGAGLHTGGNFVLSRIQAFVVDDQNRRVRSLELQKPEADFEQTAFKATEVLSEGSSKGWAVSPKVNEKHWIQFRTKRSEQIQPGEKLQIVLEQRYGDGHLLGRFRVQGIVGDARDLHLNKEVVNFLKMYPEKRVNETRDALFAFYANQDPYVQQLQQKIESLHKKSKSTVSQVRTLGNAYKKRVTHRLDRGDFLSPSEAISAGGLSALEASVSLPSSPTRLDFARWIVGPDNPLTPRVIANQIWSRLFGYGIVRTIGDFGVRGDIPTHPELLDWLAATFRDELRWNTKGFIKQIVMSNTYRQASTHRSELVDRDPSNLLLARQNRIRVEAEIVRDLTLQAAGLLSSKIGGPSVFPSMPSELAKLSYANNFTWTDSQGEDRYRRGMYTFFKRTIPHPTLMTFDCPDANLSCVTRSISNTPLQALVLLNNESFVESSRSLAERIVNASEDSKSRMDDAFRRTLCRSSREHEQKAMIALLEEARNYYATNPAAASELTGAKDDRSEQGIEWASWIATVRVLTNLDEFITRE